MFVRMTVADVEAAKRWYHQVLRFESVFDIPHTMAHLRGRRYQDLLIIKGEVPSTAGQGLTISFTWDESVDDLVPKVNAAGGRIVDGPSDRPWNARELVVEDRDGYRLSFSQQIANKKFDEVMTGVEAGKK